MITTILLLILAALAVAALIRARQLPHPDERRNLTAVGTGIAAFTLLIAFIATFTLVKAVEVGVPVSFGHVGQPMGSGVHFVAPWTDVETYPTRPITVDVHPQVRTADAGKVGVLVSGRWKVASIPAARELYFQVRTGDDDKISQDIVRRNLAQAVGDVYNTVSNVDATKREGRADQIHVRARQLLAPYGIDVSAIQLREIEPDPITAQSIADFAAQQRKTQIAQAANDTAVAEAKRRLTEANGIRAAADRLGGINPVEAQLLCVQEWANAVAAGKQLYTQPCAGSGVTPTLNTK